MFPKCENDSNENKSQCRRECATGVTVVIITKILPIFSTWSLVHLDFSFSCLTGASQIVVYISPIDNFVSLAKTRFVIWGGAILH